MSTTFCPRCAADCAVYTSPFGQRVCATCGSPLAAQPLDPPGEPPTALVRFWHGGAPGLVHHLLPPDVTKAPSNAQYGAGGVCRTDRVYVTTNREAAQMFAALHTSGRGWIYEVMPEGDLEPDPDYDHRGETDTRSYATAQARILEGRPVANPVRRAILLELMAPRAQARHAQFLARRDALLGQAKAAAESAPVEEGRPEGLPEGGVHWPYPREGIALEEIVGLPAGMHLEGSYNADGSLREVSLVADVPRPAQENAP